MRYLNRFQMIADYRLIVGLVAYIHRFASHPARWLAANSRFSDAILWKFVYLFFTFRVSHGTCTHIQIVYAQTDD